MSSAQQPDKIYPCPLSCASSMRAWNVCHIYTSCIAQPRYCVCPLHALTTWCSVQLGKMRLMIPCRALTCSHLQCFDATLYIQMNEKKPTWVCPVCDKKAPYEHLIIDGWVTLTSPTITGAGSRMSKSIILISVNLFTFISFVISLTQWPSTVPAVWFWSILK